MSCLGRIDPNSSYTFEDAQNAFEYWAVDVTSPDSVKLESMVMPDGLALHDLSRAAESLSRAARAADAAIGIASFVRRGHCFRASASPAVRGPARTWSAATTPSKDRGQGRWGLEVLMVVADDSRGPRSKGRLRRRRGQLNTDLFAEMAVQSGSL